MDNEDFSNKPLVEQIYDELFANIEKHDEFGEEAIKKLKQLASKGELKKHRNVLENIKRAEAKNETTGTGNR